jgi:photosystem II stability/assembly factor-like uncharacterized protein
MSSFGEDVMAANKLGKRIIKFFIVISFAILLPFMQCKDKITNSDTNEPKCPGIIGQWQLLGLENETITSIAIHPKDERIIYAGSMYDFSAGHMGKLFQSTDCGKNWDTLMVGQPLFSYRDIIIDPINPEIIYTIPLPILKSTDSGKTWTQITNGIRINYETRVASFVIDPKNPNVLYAGTGGFYGGTLYRSIDAGANWKDLYRSEKETPGLRDGVISLAIDPNNINTIYAGTAWRGLVLKSTDAGETWHVTALGVTNQLIHDIEIDPRNSQTIIVAISRKGFWKTDDGSSSWFSFNDGLPDSVHGIHIELNPITSEMYGVISFRDDGWIYTKNYNSKWLKFGIDQVRRSYYYSNLLINPDGKIIYFGINGLYRYRESD